MWSWRRTRDVFTHMSLSSIKITHVFGWNYHGLNSMALHGIAKCYQSATHDVSVWTNRASDDLHKHNAELPIKST